MCDDVESWGKLIDRIGFVAVDTTRFLKTSLGFSLSVFYPCIYAGGKLESNLVAWGEKVFCPRRWSSVLPKIIMYRYIYMYYK